MVARTFTGKSAITDDAFSGDVVRQGGIVVGPAPRPHARTFSARVGTATNARAVRFTRLLRPFAAKAAASSSAKAATVTTSRPGGIDLTVTNLVAAPVAPTAGQAVTFTVTVRNAGTTAVQPGRGSGSNIGTGIYVDGVVATYTNFDGGLAPGATFTLATTAGWAPGGAWTATEGTHTVRAWVDDGNLISEQNETNNTLDISLVVGPGVIPVAGARLFSDTSAWNAIKNPAQFSYLSNADAFLSSQTYGINNGPGFYVPCYFGQPNDPVHTFNVNPGWVPDRPKTFQGRAPVDMVSPAGGDGNMDVVFPDGTMLDLYQARRVGTSNTWNVAMGVDTNAYTGFGFARPDIGDNRATGTTAIGCVQAGGGILKRDIDSGSIPHGLRIAFNYASMGNQNGTQVGYAVHNDVGGGGGPIPEGALLMPSGTEPAGLSYWGQQLWAAMSTYGVWVTDKLDGIPLLFGDGSQACIDAFNGIQDEITTCCRRLRLTTVGFSYPMPWPVAEDVTSDPQGSLGPYGRSDIITMSNGFNTYCAQTMWAPNPGSAQTMSGTGPDHWNVDAIMQPAGYTGVQTYPSVLQLTNNWNPTAHNWTGDQDTPIAALTSLTGTFNLTNPPVTQGDWWAAYDIWIDGEFMIITSSSDERIATNGADILHADVNIGGVHYTDMQYGGNLNQMVMHGLPQVGTIDLLAVINYWVSQGRITPTAHMQQCNYGWELCNTDIGGVASHMTFRVNGYTLRATA